MALRTLPTCAVLSAALLSLAACSGSATPPQGGSSGSSTATTGSGSTGSTGTSGSTGASGTSGTTGGTQLVLLHTNDLHGHLEGHEPELDYSPLTPGDDATRGGFARIAAKVQAERAAAATANQVVILADSGDFMMGTAFSSFLGTSQATELYEMSQMGYDAITLGNHEFDFTSRGTAAVIAAAHQRGANPPLVATNMVVPTDGGAAELADIVTTHADWLPPKRVVTLSNGLKVGFIGLLGENAAAVAPLAKPVTFTNIVAAAQPVVDELRSQDHVDLVIALSHSGTDEQGNGEDAQLAQGTHGIDIIVSGHTHVELPQPVTVNGTLIVSSGAYGRNLGKMVFTFVPGQPVTLDSYALMPVDDSVAGDATVQGRIDGYAGELDALLADGGAPFGYLTPIAKTTFDLDNTAFTETNLGDLVTDAYRAAADAIPGAPTTDVAIEASGNIRVALLQGKTGGLTFGDIFNVTPLGIGPDGRPGYPLAAFYLNGKDLKAGLELSAAAESNLKNNDYFLQLSGLTYSYDPNAAFLGRVTSASVGGNAVSFTDTTTCYRIVSTYYVASLLGLVSSATGGALSVTPKHADCTTTYDAATLPQTILDANPSTTQVEEIKQWRALLGYILNQPVSGNAPQVASIYGQPQGRITKQ